MQIPKVLLDATKVLSVEHTDIHKTRLLETPFCQLCCTPMSSVSHVVALMLSLNTTKTQKTSKMSKSCCVTVQQEELEGFSCEISVHDCLYNSSV